MAKAKQVLFLLDAMALLYRAHFVFIKNPRINSKGMNTSALYGFTNTVLDILLNKKPTHLGVVYDTSAPTFRHKLFPDYKAQRQEIPEDLRIAIPWSEKVLNAMQIPVIKMDGYEADDIIATMAIQAAQEGFEVYMMTPDKDYGQVVDKNIYIYRPGRGGKDDEILGIPEINAQWNISHPAQLIDILGLMGDSVDNISGVPGIGEKTAMDLIQRFGSIENIYNHLDELKPKVKENLITHKAKAELSKTLAAIDTKVPLHFNDFNLIVEAVNKEATQEVFNELEFKSMIKRLFGDASSGIPQQTSLFSNSTEVKKEIESIEESDSGNWKTIQDVEHQYFTITSEKEIKELVKKLSSEKELCIDTETTGLDTLTAELVGISLSNKAHSGWYIPVEPSKEDCQTKLNCLKPLLESKSITWIGQNIKYDYMIFKNHGIELNAQLFDTMISHYLLEPDQRHKMDTMSESMLGYRPIPIDALIGAKGKDQLNMRDVPLEKIAEYATEDADITFQLKQKMVEHPHFPPIEKVFSKIEMPLIPVLARMELHGVRIDLEPLRAFSDMLQSEMQLNEKEIMRLCGVNFNINSPKQLGDVLFEKLQLDPKAKKTKTGQYKTDEEVLTNLLDKHPVIQCILDQRQNQKLKSTYVDALPEMIHPITGRVHTSYNQAVAATGRLSSNNPNLQNIPIRTERGKEVRKAFIPTDNKHQLVSADYSQIELRLIADIAKEENMIQAFKDKQDIHSITAAKLFGVEISDVNSEMRRKAKTVNFGIIYGISAFGLSQRLSISRTEAKEIIDNYNLRFPAILTYMESTKEFARKNGFVETIMGRRRYIRDINSANATVRGFAERNAINAPVQGSAADMIKLAMIQIDRQLQSKKMKSKMVMQVHDELVFDAVITEIPTLKEIVLHEMIHAMPGLKVPIEVEIGVGDNWLEAH